MGDLNDSANGKNFWQTLYGLGYRVYFVQRGQTLVILLAGGDKHTQQQDIKTAQELAQKL
jgi:putative addiction module killer protein